MKKEHDFSRAKRAKFRNLPLARDLKPKTKVRITIMIDLDVLDFFKARASRPGSEPYQTQINRALRQYMSSEELSALGVSAESARTYSAAAKTGKRRTRTSPKTMTRKGGPMLQRTIKAVIRPGEQSGYVAECVELPVVTQGKTLDEVSLNLREAVELHLADENLNELGIAPDPVILVTLELSPTHA